MTIEISGLDVRLDNLDSKMELILQLLAKSNNKVSEPQKDRLLTKKETANLLSCSVSTIDNYRRKGILKRHHIGSAVRFKKNEVLAAIEQMNDKKKAN